MVTYKDSNKYDHQKGWFLPDDLIREFEHPDDSAKRILTEQLGISGIDVKINHFESFIGNDKSWHLIFHYVCYLKKKITSQPSNEIQDCKWFSLDSLPPKNDIAHHGWALFTLEEILREK